MIATLSARGVIAALFYCVTITGSVTGEAISADEMSDVVRAAYPGDICDWDSGSDILAEATSWELDIRYEYDEPDGPERSLTLYQLPCFRGAYNLNSIWVTVDKLEGLKPLHFAHPVVDIRYSDESDAVIAGLSVTGFEAIASLVNAEFDIASRTITSFSKWRGLGDASSGGVWQFENGRFVLKTYEVDGSFDGEINPVTVYESAQD